VKHETDLDDVTENLFLCQFVLPEKQYLAWKDSLQGPDSERIRDKVRKLKRTLASIQSASFWHSLPPEEKAKAFHDAVRTGVPVTLRYATPDGTFFLTALDIRAGEAIGLLVSTTRQFAYGPYPLSRLLNEDGRMLSSIQETPLEYVCEEQGIDTALPLPTPRQLLHWEDRK
jgi:hypothetical protein